MIVFEDDGFRLSGDGKYLIFQTLTLKNSNLHLHFSFSWRFYPKRLSISALNHEGTNPEQQESRKYNFFKNPNYKVLKVSAI